MKPFLFSDTFAKTFSVFIALFIAGTAVAWTGPGGNTAPNGNVSQPINQGSTVQVKSGALGTTGTFTANKVGAPELCLSSDLTSCITTWAQAISQGGGGGDNLGNHFATAHLAMNGYNIQNAGDIYTSNNYGRGLVGLYSDTRYQGVFAMGDAYKLTYDGTSPGSLYGIAWTHSNIGGQSKAGLGHQALFMSAGVTQTAIGSGIWTSGNITAPFFYDQQNTAYYVDPNSYSNVYALQPAYSFNGAVADYNDGNYYIDPNGYSRVSTIQPTYSFNGPVYDYNSGGYYVDPHSISIFNQIRAQFIYDQDNTGYYLDPGGYSNVHAMQPYYSFNGPVYDYNNGGYYVDPHSVSQFNVLYAYYHYYGSDRRLKENIKPLTEGLRTVLALRGVTFDWRDKSRGEGTQVGFIAQEVESVAPDLVTTNAEGIKGVDYARVTPLLVEAIKAQQAQIDALKADIEALKAR